MYGADYPFKAYVQVCFAGITIDKTYKNDNISGVFSWQEL